MGVGERREAALLPGEVVLLFGMVVKRKGFISKTREVGDTLPWFVPMRAHG